VSMCWSAEQREWLQALGYDLLVRAPQLQGSADASAVDARAMDLPVAAMAASNVERAAAVTSRAENGVDPLLRAMLRAARIDALEDVRAIAGDIGRLRADPAAKRAAWPQLRTLRARHRR
jgi:hypothetical protein